MTPTDPLLVAAGLIARRRTDWAFNVLTLVDGPREEETQR